MLQEKSPELVPMEQQRRSRSVQGTNAGQHLHQMVLTTPAASSDETLERTPGQGSNQHPQTPTRLISVAANWDRIQLTTRAENCPRVGPTQQGRGFGAILQTSSPSHSHEVRLKSVQGHFPETCQMPRTQNLPETCLTIPLHYSQRILETPGRQGRDQTARCNPLLELRWGGQLGAFAGVHRTFSGLNFQKGHQKR